MGKNKKNKNKDAGLSSVYCHEEAMVANVLACEAANKVEQEKITKAKWDWNLRKQELKQEKEPITSENEKCGCHK